MKSISNNPSRVQCGFSLSVSTPETIYHDADTPDKTLKCNRHKEEGNTQQELAAKDWAEILRELDAKN